MAFQAPMWELAGGWGAGWLCAFSHHPVHSGLLLSRLPHPRGVTVLMRQDVQSPETAAGARAVNPGSGMELGQNMPAMGTARAKALGWE